MTLFFTITLCISILGLFSLITAKRYEMRTGKVLLGGVRRIVGRSLHVAMLFVEQILPALVRHSFLRLWHSVRSYGSRIIARATLYLERKLHRILAGMHSMMHPPQGGGEVSAFLREVAEHKRTMLRRSPENRVIFDD